jgi:MoCo/4Fe-4S cofactor protein with predicted Tat translocation signal
MGMEKKYWKGMDELKETPQFLESRDQEFPAQQSVDEFLGDESIQETSTNRRDFLKFLGFSVAAATVAACEAPVTKAVPYVNKPEDVTPGMPTWYASTYYDGNSYASILVKTREGRPIFIKGNKDYGITKGTVNPQIIASVLGLYDGERLTNPVMEGEASSFGTIDKKIRSGLRYAKNVALVTNTVISPSLATAIDELKASLGEGKVEHIQYDAVSHSAIRAAHKESFGLMIPSMDPEDTTDRDGIIPSYDFSSAKTIVGIGADFLNSWLMPTVFAGQYASRRNPDGDWMSQHFQFESMMSITGSNADYRAMIKPSEQANVLAYLLKEFGVSTSVSANLSEEVKAIANKAAKALKKSKGESLVVCDSNNKSVQMLVNKLNHVLGAYSKTINVNDPINMFRSEDEKMDKFVKSVISGKGRPDAVVFMGVNPVYTLSNGADFAKGLEKIKTTVAVSLHADETASKCKFIAPSHHGLEAWADYAVTNSHYAIAQPTIRPLHNTASTLESVLVWAGKAKRGGKDSKVAYDYIKGLWEQYGFNDPNQTKYTDFHSYWTNIVHNSCQGSEAPAATEPAFTGSLSGLKAPKGGDLEIVLYQKAGIGTGLQAGNPWLQEMPDPMTKVTWDNYITMNPVEMEKAGYVTTYDQENGLNQATIKVGDASFTLPVYPLPGQAFGTVGVALGYGRGANAEKIGKAAYQTAQYGGYITDENDNPKPIGANAFMIANGDMFVSGSMTKAEGLYPIAATQIQHTAMGRHSVVRETTLHGYETKDKEAYNPTHLLGFLNEEGEHDTKPVSEFDLWDEHPVENIGHRWGMTIDLSSCIGCGSCLIACQAENNVPVVGKDEVRKGREMHWLRIDRYFASEEEAAVGSRKDHEKSKIEWFADAEHPAANPSVVHMPMMCHHCNHAPCETVCPVAATTHSNEGLNQMTYNRCIGTRYCANNCPYKVRRFNWFNYPSYKAQAEINPAQDDLGRMVLNPDVTVRTRGVMEKCSFCVQRIQATKLDAKSEGRPIMDGELSTACSDSCPTNAIIVGDWNDKESMIRKSADDKRAYQALEEIGVKPNVWFKVKVRNNENKELDELQVVEAHGHGGHGDHGDDHGHDEHKENTHH